MIEILNSFKSIKEYNIENELFLSSDVTKPSIHHLLEVSSGLKSLVFGDAEIISQIKKAHQFSMLHKLQGSLLERALQAVFKTHKRISNETDFRDGTTSVAYKSLKVVRESFDKESVKSKKILFIGAGDIVKQLFKYNAKFNYNNIYVSNRSIEKAILLAQDNTCKTFPFSNVINNRFEDFDVIISAASNCPNLIKAIPDAQNKTLLIDLAVPCNIDKTLRNQENVIFHDLDSISVELEETKEHRIAATDAVNLIISEEVQAYCEWLQNAPLRAILAELKIKVRKRVKTRFENNIEDSNLKKITNQVMKKLMVKKELTISDDKIDFVISDEIATIHF
jgi:glutamyl-tRNA reductase